MSCEGAAEAGLLCRQGYLVPLGWSPWTRAPAQPSLVLGAEAQGSDLLPTLSSSSP